MSLFEIFLLAVGLSMDAFAVSLCKGLAAKKAGIRECLICGIWFGIFQGLMPFIGYLISSWFEKWISIVAPWVAFILLSIIGINMIREAFSEEEEAILAARRRGRSIVAISMEMNLSEATVKRRISSIKGKVARELF